MEFYIIPQLCMPAVPRRAVRTVTTKRMISVQVFFFIVIEEPTPALPKGGSPATHVGYCCLLEVLGPFF